MSDRAWFRSLYWRIAIGFVAFVATLMVVQGALTVWFLAQSSDDVAGRSTLDLAALVANDVGTAWSNDDNLDVESYLKDHFGSHWRPVALVLPDGRMFVSQAGAEIPPQLREAAARRLARMAGGTPSAPSSAAAARGAMGARGAENPTGAARGGDRSAPAGQEGSTPGAAPGMGTGQGRGIGSARGMGIGRGMGPGRGGAPGFGRGGFGQGPGIDPGGGRGGGRPPGLYNVVVKDMVRALVVVPPNTPLALVVRQLAPIGLALAALLVVVGTTLASVFVFRPAHKRLGQLEDAARRLGTGDATARAPETGGDEIASVARAFNTMAADLTTRAEALRAADQNRRQLLADVSHELMTPLTAIRGYLETLAMTELDLNTDTRQRYLGIVREETARLERLIGDLTDLARLEAGGRALAKTEIAVEDVFRRVVERHERDAAEKGVTLTTRIDPAGMSLHVDPVRIEQALQNLAANALRHTPSLGTIELTAHSRPDGAVLAVRDSGEGIPAEHIGHVFDRFYKADTSRAGDQRGSGLGLSIVKAIVERHGGRITVQSQEGAGTVFEIVLPRPAGSDLS